MNPPPPPDCPPAPVTASAASAPGNKRRGRRGFDLVGRAFRCPDGCIRWVTGMTPSGLLTARWLGSYEARGVPVDCWMGGGNWKVQNWPGGEEYPAPAPGTHFLRNGALGEVSEFVAGDRQAGQPDRLVMGRECQIL